MFFINSLIPAHCYNPTQFALTLLCVVFFWAASICVSMLTRLEIDRRKFVKAVREKPQQFDESSQSTVFQPPEKRLSVIFPSYNEGARLPITLDETIKYLNERQVADPKFTFEIIVVDDGSCDDTVARAKEYSSCHPPGTVRVAKQKKNMGKGAAVRLGSLLSRGELVLFADADGATRISDAGVLEEQLAALGMDSAPGAPGSAKTVSADMKNDAAAVPAPPPPPLWTVPLSAFGSRAHLEKQAVVTRKWYRNILMYGFHFCVVVVVGHGVRDTQCGFKMFTRAAARLLFSNQRLERWCFDVELLFLCKRLGIRVVEVPVAWTEVSGSKLRPSSILHMLLELFLVRAGYNLGIWKIQAPKGA